MSAKQLHTVILGAGVSGLAAAWNLHHRHAVPLDQIAILEAAPRAGGWIHSERRNGFLCEYGPRGFRPTGRGTATLRLAAELGLEAELIAASPNATRRFLYKDQRLQALPHGIGSFFLSKLTRPVLRALWREWRVPRSERDESIASFFTRRFNSSVVENLIDPMVAGIYAGQPTELSLRCCFPQIHRWEQARGSVVMGLFRGPRSESVPVPEQLQHLAKLPLLSFRNGMQTLTDRLSERLAPALHLSHAVSALTYSDHWTVETGSGSIEAKQVLSTLPAPAIGKLLGEAELCDLPLASLALVHVAFDKEVLPEPGFGYLVPSSEKEAILGVVWDSSVFPEQNVYPDETRLTVMIGGMRRPELVHQPDADLIAIATEALQRHCGIYARPAQIHVTRAEAAIPQFPVDFASVRERLKQKHPHLHLSGTVFNGVAVNDCVFCVR